MKKSIFLFFALVAGALNVFAQECVKTPTTLKGTASVTLSRYVHKNLRGLFSVKVTSDTVFVYFSQGNLQYQASTDTWRFAEQQYDVIGNAAGNTTSTKNRPTQSAWIDLFGWGCSGYDNGATAYQPWASSNTNEDYFADGDLVRVNAEADWALHNAIINGGLDANGPAAHKWRTLTASEWNFLFQDRINATNLYGMGTLNGVNGIFLLPDHWDWDSVAGGSFESGWTPASSSSAFSANTVTDLALWTILENAGVVFIPSTGNRLNLTVRNPENGYYWSTTANGTTVNTTKCLYFADGVLPLADNSHGINKKTWARAVRAVREPSSVDAAAE